jgi:hypothetical protein
MIETIVIFVGKAAASAVFDAIKDKVFGIEYQEVTVKDWARPPCSPSSRGRACDRSFPSRRRQSFASTTSSTRSTA